MDQLCHLGAVGQNGQLLGRIACRRADGLDHRTAGHTARQKRQHIRAHPLGAEGHGGLAQRLFQQRRQGDLLFVLIEQDAQHILSPDVRRIAQHKGGPLLPQVGFQRLAHPQHTGGAVLHLQSNADARYTGQHPEDGFLHPGKTAQGRARALGKVVGQHTAADQRGRAEPHPTQQRTHHLGRPLGVDGQLATAAGKQLQHIAVELGQAALCIQKKVVEIAEDQRIFDGIAHSLFPPVR